MCFGPARLLSSNQVKEIESKIGTITREQLYKNIDPEEMEKLDFYPNIWETEGDEAFDYVAEYFEILKTFIENYAANNVGMALYLS